MLQGIYRYGEKGSSSGGSLPCPAVMQSNCLLKVIRATDALPHRRHCPNCSGYDDRCRQLRNQRLHPRNPLASAQEHGGVSAAESYVSQAYTGTMRSKGRSAQRLAGWYWSFSEIACVFSPAEKHGSRRGNRPESSILQKPFPPEILTVNSLRSTLRTVIITRAVWTAIRTNLGEYP